MYLQRLTILGSLLYSLCLSAPAIAQLGIEQHRSLPEVKAEVLDNPIMRDPRGIATFRIALEVPPDHHGYLDAGDEGFLIPFSFSFPLLEGRGAQIVTLGQPSGSRDDKAHATVLRGKGTFTFSSIIPTPYPPSNDPVTGSLRYQICNDVTNVCYPPRERDLLLRFAMMTGSPASMTMQRPDPPAATSLTISEHLALLFQRYMRHSILAFVLVFAAGLLASATPCVYPVLPITSAIIVARGGHSHQRGLLHALAYFLGIIFFYAMLGILAATTGTALSALMTNAWVNLGFAIIFTYFGLSMLGLYEFQFLPGLTAQLDTTVSHRGGVSGTFLMGTTAGLVVSPCVGPVVGAILLEIAGQTAGAGSGGVASSTSGFLRGVVLMISFGMGLGVPFLLIGLLSHWAPQSGAWLIRVKFILGLPILYFAYTYYLKAMETAGVPENVAHAMLMGVVTIGLAVFIGAFYHLGENPRPSLLLRRTVGIILLIVGIHFLYNGLRHSGILLTVSRSNVALPAVSENVSPLQTSVEIHGNLPWLRDFSTAQARAQLERKPLFVDFYATWCANCKAFARLTLQDIRLNTALQQAILVKIYDTDTIFRAFQQDANFPELGGIRGQPFLPLFAIYAPQGGFVWKGQNYEAVQTMIAQLERAKHAGP